MWVLLPLKKFSQAKQRLSHILTKEERMDFSRHMVKDVLTVLQSHPDITNIVIVSNEPEAADIAFEFGAQLLTESSLNVNGLNDAIQSATSYLEKKGISELMILHGDLPLITGNDVSRLIKAHRKQSCSVKHGFNPTITIAPDTKRRGTNCLICTPAAKMKYSYGDNSFTAHAVYASHINMVLEIVCLPGMACDIDTLKELEFLLDRVAPNVAPYCYKFINSISLRERLESIDTVSEAMNIGSGTLAVLNR